MHINGLVRCLAYAECSVSCDGGNDGIDISGTWKMSRSGISREEEGWLSGWIMRKEMEQTWCWGEVLRRYNFLIPLPEVTKYLLAEQIEERRRWMLQSQSAALKLFTSLEACQMYPLTLGPCFMNSPHLFFLLFELRPNARWVIMKSSRHSQSESNLWYLQVQAQLLPWP